MRRPKAPDLATYVRQRTRVDPDGCWRWTGTLSYGYGKVNWNKQQLRAHRVSYELANGPIPPGLVVDHLCRNIACVNPQHLEAVTQAENLARGVTLPAINSRKTACPQGHPLDDGNTVLENGTRSCRHCGRKKLAARRAGARSRSLPFGPRRNIVRRLGDVLYLECGHQVIRRKANPANRRATCNVCHEAFEAIAKPKEAA